MLNVIPLIDSLPMPDKRKGHYYVRCPFCDIQRAKRGGHMNINLDKNCFRCNKCGFSGGVFALYSFYKNIPIDEVKRELDDIFRGSRSSKPDAPKRAVPPSTVIESSLADIEDRDAVYSAFLSMLRLDRDHYRNLYLRGLSQKQIALLGYKTTPSMDRFDLADRLTGKGFDLAGVPGFGKTRDGKWYVSHTKRGILIPARDLHGRIQGLHIRCDDESDGKFRWFTTDNKVYRCTSRNWVHISGKLTKTVLLTEGYMKGDIINIFDGRAVISLPGVSSLSQLREVLPELKKRGVNKILTAFDMDFLTNEQVRDCYDQLTQLISEIGLEHARLLWDAMQHGEFLNGLDDYQFKHQRRMEYLARLQG